MPKGKAGYAGAFSEEHISPKGRGGAGASASMSKSHFCGVSDATLRPDGKGPGKKSLKGSKGY